MHFQKIIWTTERVTVGHPERSKHLVPTLTYSAHYPLVILCQNCHPERSEASRPCPQHHNTLPYHHQKHPPHIRINGCAKNYCSK